MKAMLFLFLWFLLLAMGIVLYVIETTVYYVIGKPINWLHNGLCETVFLINDAMNYLKKRIMGIKEPML